MRVQTKLTAALFGLTLVITITIVALSLNSFTGSLREGILNDVKSDAYHTLDKLDRSLFERVSDIKFMTNELNSVLLGDLHKLEEKVAYLKQIEKSRQVYSSMSLYDQKGVRIADTQDNQIGLNEYATAPVAAALRGEIYTDEVPVFDEALGEQVLRFSGPLINEHGEISGALVTRYPTSQIEDILDTPNRFPNVEHLHVDLISQEGMVIYSTRPEGAFLEHLMRDHNLMQKVQKTPGIPHIEKVPSHQHTSTGSVEEASLFVAVSESGFLDFAGNNWTMLVQVQESDIFGSINKLITELLVVSLLLIVLTIPLAYLLANSISKPIHILHEAAQKVANGNYNVKTNIKTDDEIGRLSKSFDKMAKTIKDLLGTLEHRVQKRTRQVESRLRQLQKFQKVTVDRELAMMRLKEEKRKLREKIDELGGDADEV